MLGIRIAPISEPVRVALDMGIHQEEAAHRALGGSGWAQFLRLISPDCHWEIS
ncbi:hypothetical protein RSAG8_12023, partial [Rhizoctonia solani AG-8 WAC10335]